MDNIIFLILLIFSEILLVFLSLFVKKQKKSQMKVIFSLFLMAIGWWILCMILQIMLENTSIDPFFFEKIAAFGVFPLSSIIILLGMIFAQTKISFKPQYLLLFVFPIFSLIVLWTNNLHHLFFVSYSTNMNEVVTGPFHIINAMYFYGSIVIGVIYLLRYSIKNAGFFSRQSLLIILGILIPLVINVLGTFNVIPMSVYYTPMSLSFTLLFFALAIFKFGFLNVTPIAMQRVVDRMSDSFLVISDDGIITDFNETFLKTFNLKSENVRKNNFISFIKSSNLKEFDEAFINSILNETKVTEKTIIVKREMKIKNNYFNIEASGIFSKNAFLGTLILLKDVTQHMKDMQTIRTNQNMLMERERLASLGQLIGGIAHNLKTPIMSISGAAEGLTDLIKEYEASVGDPEVTIQDHHDIAKDMKEWIEKIRSYTEYMSDVITAVKGQAVTMSEEQAISFNLDELVKRVNILMRHELKNALVELNIKMKADPNTLLQGNINSLVQVINNMISNAIQAYNGKSGSKINLTLEEDGKNVIISVEDFGDGLSEEVQAKLFKEMITTKGKNGTGLGLFMSYSTIRAHFNGSITFETQKNKGTTFHIILPV